jgi:ribosomal protein S15P/S13E
MANGRCRFHGGRSLSGPAAPQFKHGRYSKYLPTRLLSKYKEAMADPDVLSLRSEIAVVDSRLQEVLERVYSGESGYMWKQLGEVVQQLLSSRNDPEAMSGHINNLIAIVRRGNSDTAAWNEARNVIDQRRRLVEAERRRMVEAQQMLSTEQTLVLLTYLTSIIRESVQKHTDERAGNLILADTSSRIRELVADTPS